MQVWAIEWRCEQFRHFLHMIQYLNAYQDRFRDVCCIRGAWQMHMSFTLQHPPCQVQQQLLCSFQHLSQHRLAL